MKTIQCALTGIITGMLALFSVTAQGQDRCGTMPALEAAFKNDPALRARFEQQELDLQRFIATRKNNPAAKEAATLTVPVVFHIVLPNPSVVTDAQLQAQIDVLNKIYAGANADTVKIPARFKPLFGRAGIQFCLARRTPDGKVTTGINRYTTTQSSFSTNNNVKHAATGGANAWSTTSYLNIWLCQLSGGVLGYATFPNTGSGSEQGVVIDYRSLPGGSLINYNGGKTTAHEIGHYFNLRHIWGDDDGACSGTDFIDDTPNQANMTYGTPSTDTLYDACTGTGGGIMYQNYMDYTDDGAMEMFTLQQVARMQTAATTYRPGLFTSSGCVPVAAKNYDATVRSINSPFKRVCATDFSPMVTIANKGVVTITSLVISARVDNGAVVTTNWTGSVAALDSFTVTLPGLSTGTGTHTLTIYTAAPNGIADEIPADDTLRTSLFYYDPLTTPFSESFEGSSYPPQGWDIVNDDGALTWEKVSGPAKTGAYSVVMRNYNDANLGTQDYLRLPQVVIANADSAFMSFRVAAGFSGAGLVFAWDTLDVLVSTDCGASYTSLYKKWGSTLSTTNRSITGAYLPQEGEWRKDSINLTPYIGKGKLLIAFRNTNEDLNNIFLDDINIYSKQINPNLRRKGFLITPSPTTGLVNVDFYPNPTNLQGIAIYSMSGQEVAKMRAGNGAGASHYSFNLAGLAAGIYVVKVVYADTVVTQKILKN